MSTLQPSYPDEFGVPEIEAEREKYGPYWPAFLAGNDVDWPADE